MVHRRDLLEHFEWLAGSHLLEDALDEAMIAIALCAHGSEWAFMKYGAAWRPASGVVEVYKLERFVESERAHLERSWGPTEANPPGDGYAGIP